MFRSRRPLDRGDVEMRKAVLASVVMVLLGALLLNPASAAVKAGTSCTKLNQTTVATGYVYICLKSGKKLVWVRGVKVPTPKPSPSASATFTAKPSTSPIAIGDPAGAIGSTTSPTPTPVPTLKPSPSPTKILHPNMTKPVINAVLTPGFRSYTVTYDFQPGDEHYDVIIFESLTGEFKGEQYIVYVGTAKSAEVLTGGLAPRWVLIRTRDQWSDLNVSDIKVGPVTPKNPDPDTSTAPPPPTNVQVFCRLNDSSPWVLCSTP